MKTKPELFDVVDYLEDEEDIQEVCVDSIVY